ncbi:hypothetical protein BJX96DRAFT_185593 [Aspergillus floccosus]
MAGLMSSAGAYMSRLWRKESPYVRICLFGPGAAGKSTLLYRLVEAERLPLPSEQFDFEIWELAGGCSSVPLWLFQHLVKPDVICLFIVDSSDPCDYVKYELDDVVRNIEEAKHFAVVFNHNDQNDQAHTPELKKMVNDKIRSCRGSRRYGPTYEVYDDLDRFNAATGEQVDILLKRLIHVAKTTTPHLRDKPAMKSVLPEADIPKPSRQELLQRIEERSKESVHQLPPDQFLGQMIAGTLSTWDHMCHLRAGFLCLMESIMEEDVVFAAAELFLQRLDAMLRASPGKFRNTFHRTLTIFWMHRIHLQMLLARQKTGVLPSYDSFTEFLRQCPELMDGQTWDQYWTKNVLFGPEAREAWVLPDLKPLPRYHSSAQSVKPKKIQGRQSNAQIYQRFAYGVVKAVKSTDQRRAAIINDTLPIIQSYLIQLRSKSQSTGNTDPYSLTQAHFWIQMTHAAVESIPPTQSVDVTKLSFETFGTLFPELIGAEDLWAEYYTPEQWNSVEARIRTVLPRKKPLPNYFPPPSQAQMDKAIGVRLDEKYAIHDDNTPSALDGRPGSEELYLRVRWAVKSTTVMREKPDHYDVSTDSHAVLLRRLFNRLIMTDPTGTGGRLISQVVWEEMAFLHGRGQYTCAVFWARMIMAAFARMDAAFRKQVEEYRGLVEEAEMEAAETRLFSHFLSASMELCWEHLWATYYSDEVWRSKDAAEGYVLPDKRPLPAYIEERLN